MSHLKIRQEFLNFFKLKGHKIVPSSLLLTPDPSILFTTAGMQQFKRYYLDLDSPYGNKVASIQKCLRTSDIDQVGDESHLTFFEMLGNFSFKYPQKDSYFKETAINLAWEFINKILKISENRIKISIFKGDSQKNIPFDQESFDAWKRLGVPDDKLIFGGKEDNFWGPTGDQGPCGPTTEIYIDGIEIWNLVFNEYFCDKEGNLSLLRYKGVDTGMGLERLAMVLQGNKSVFETDLFQPIISELRGRKLVDFETHLKSERIIADHLRAVVFLISEGVIPSNTEAGYVLRRLIRRLIRYAKMINLENDFYQRSIKTIIKIYKHSYPELEKKEEEIVRVIENEYNKFDKSLIQGLKEFNKILLNIKTKQTEPKISGVDAFHLYQSFGFPIEFTQELAKEEGLEVNLDEFYHHQEEHRSLSRVGQEKKFGGHGLILNTGELKAANEEEVKIVTRLHTATHLLHSALRRLFGPSIKQEGSDITSKRLRFDFSFNRKLTNEEIKKLENIVNEAIKMDLKVYFEEMPFEKAIESGALAFFKEKYPKIVKVYTIESGSGYVFSKEICGGPHVSHTKEIGKFKIIKEEGIASGIRRIRAIVE